MGLFENPALGAAGPSNSAPQLDLEVKVEVKAEPKIEPNPEPEIKEEVNDDTPWIISATNNPPKPSRSQPKKEEDEGPKLHTVLPSIGDDMFGDVDGYDKEEEEIVDETYEGIAHVNGVPHFVCEGFKIRQVPEPLVVKRSLHDLNACILHKSIVLDPDYQREVVWDEGRAALLITSILMGYFIPPIIFNVRQNTPDLGVPASVKIVRVCVDGKQRLTSIWKFMTGRIGFFDTSTPQRKWYFCYRTENGRQVIDSRNILPKAVRDHFSKQYFCCYEYSELDPDTEETMFQLVQKGIALTAAEKMRSVETEWARLARQFEEDYELIVNLSKQSRASGFRLVLTIFAMIQEVLLGGFYSTARKNKGIRRPLGSKSVPPVLQASPTALMKLLEDRVPITDNIKATLTTVFDKYEYLVKLSSLQVTTTRWRIRLNSTFDPNPQWLIAAGLNQGRSFSPLEFVATAVLIGVLMTKRDDEQLLADVRGLRKYLRVSQRDLRVNSQCWSLCWKYIAETMDQHNATLPSDSVPPEDNEAESTVNKKLSVEAFLSARASKYRSKLLPDGSDTDSELSHLPSELDYDTSGDEEVDGEDPDASRKRTQAQTMRDNGKMWNEMQKAVGEARAIIAQAEKIKAKEKRKEKAREKEKKKRKLNGNGKGKGKRTFEDEDSESDVQPTSKKPRGRPSGSKNRNKKKSTAKRNASLQPSANRRRRRPVIETEDEEEDDEDYDSGTEFPNLSALMNITRTKERNGATDHSHALNSKNAEAEDGREIEDEMDVDKAIHHFIENTGDNNDDEEVEVAEKEGGEEWGSASLGRNGHGTGNGVGDGVAADDDDDVEALGVGVD